MPKTTRSKRIIRSRRSGEYSSPAETPVTALSVIGSAQIPAFKSQVPQRVTFRVALTSGVGLTTAWTTTMMLDYYAIAVGGSASPVRIYNNMKLLGVKLWQPSQVGDTPDSAAGFLAIEFSPSTTAGFGGAPRVPYTASATVDSKYAHLCVRPKRSELASCWFSAQQANYVLFNCQAVPQTVMQLDFLVTNVNGETPVTVAYTSSVAKGTVGVTNFGVAGCRSIGLENLVNP